jgi:hypothetical protein
VKKYFKICTKKAWSKVFLIIIYNFIFVNIAYMENKIGLYSHLEIQGKKGILELVHSDVFGPTLVPSFGGSLYYFSFIDYFSSKTWLYFPRKKSMVFYKFKEFKSLTENQIDKKIKVLRTSSRRELCGNDFEKFCK